jgi:hypothetical protein
MLALQLRTRVPVARRKSRAAPPPPDPGAPDGEYRVAWTAEELEAAFVAAIENGFTDPIWNDDGLRAFLLGLAAENAGSYSLRLSGGRFELLRDGGDRPLCAGSMRYDAPRLALLAERGSFCYPSVLFEGEVTIDRDELRIDRSTMRAEFPSIVLFGTRALERR